ncbi:hypothetical protein MICAH_4910008 [Microcystis aeruginosa PCC 9809]|uniref:Uncharacterized protein n=1 Tax=Microcystis aeruginosa PCC 9809 TaxID=1160285 RepID=I4I1M2_MICAE|nr:hypothetical protein [Microcystis aeruginosa]CCI28196.1 hypothetical protein MICAH_4910008 [Microcystis aeruginosa PCC 9809]
MDITIHLSQEQREKLAYIQQHSDQDITTLLNQVIEQQYTKLHPRNSDALKVLKESGWLFSTLCDNFCLWNREMLTGQDF